MKKRTIFFAAIYAVVANVTAFAVDLPDEPATNYVVIGAFAIESNAIDHVETAKKLKYNAVYEINPNRHLYYVYVLRTGDAGLAFTEAARIRKETPFWDTWVYNGTLGAVPVTKASDVPAGEHPTAATTQNKDTPAAERPTGSTPGGTDTSVMAQSVPKDTVAAAPEPLVPKEGEKIFYFKIFSKEGEVAGDVDMIDVERTKKVASYKGNQPVILRAVNKSGNVTLVCGVFGYRKLQINLNFNQPEETEGAVVEEGKVTIPFELVHLQKGDFGVMYNVYFFKDAAIMRPESKYEVVSLTNMMKGNLKYKIRIHGHTNGNAPGKVISMGESKNFFSLNNTKEGYGSAKKLSQERAEVIRDFLISEGIDGSRMEIKAWGGKKPLYDKLSPQAQANVRVEVEILEDK
jgi:outer membrane protein OmpA-like peptidoglycan-associated protein